MLRNLISAFVLLAAVTAFAETSQKNSPKRKAASEISDNDVLEKAKQFEMGCQEGAPIDLQKFTNKYRYKYETEKNQEHETYFYMVSCLVGAYNTASVLFNNDSLSGSLQIVPLATPEYNEKTKKIIGWRSDAVNGGLSYDPKTKLLTSFSKGRGLGDIGTFATYAIFESMVILRKYESDTTMDGKVNPKVIYETKEPLVH